MFEIIESRIPRDPYPYHVVLQDFSGRYRAIAYCPRRADAERIVDALNASATVALAS